MPGVSFTPPSPPRPPGASATASSTSPVFRPKPRCSNSFKWAGAVARPGSSFNLVNPVKIENPGTEDLVNPSVDVYLVPKRFSLGGAIFVKRVRPRTTIRSGEAQNVTIGRVALPGSAPAGTYYFAFVLRVPGDGYPANNSAWSNYDVRITVKP